MKRKINKRRKDATVSKISRVGGKRACLCSDSTYHVDCCDGTLQAQGIGKV